MVRVVALIRQAYLPKPTECEAQISSPILLFLRSFSRILGVCRRQSSPVAFLPNNLRVFRCTLLADTARLLPSLAPAAAAERRLPLSPRIPSLAAFLPLCAFCGPHPPISQSFAIHEYGCFLGRSKEAVKTDLSSVCVTERDWKIFPLPPPFSPLLVKSPFSHFALCSPSE
ncbi:Hypothetical predicted protein, partial [Podarcis lilfordi]